MNKSLCILIALVIFIITASCSNSKEKSKTNKMETAVEGAILKAGSRSADDVNEPDANNCLLNYQDRYDELLTEEMVLATTGFSKEVMNIKYSKALKDPKYHSISYRFANKRIGKPIGMEYDVELQDEMALKSIKLMSLNQFKDAYRVVSHNETSMANKAIDDATDGKSASEEANNKIKDLEKSGVDKATIKGVTTTMKSTFAKVGKSYTSINDLGDASTWNSFTQSLNVLQNGVHFELFVNMSGEDIENKKIAVEIARKILNHCK